MRRVPSLFVMFLLAACDSGGTFFDRDAALVGLDGGGKDRGIGDAGLQPANDLPRPDGPRPPDGFIWPDIWPAQDLFTAMDLPSWPDKGATPDKGGAAPDKGSGGAVARGVYSYAAVPVYGLLNPPAAMYHPKGDHALLLDASDKVHRYTVKTNAVAQVATAPGVTWRAVAFVASGASAVLLGNHSASNTGRVYVWDHAGGKLSELTAERFAGGTYQALALSAGGASFKLLGSKKSSGAGYLAYLWDLDPAKGRTNVKATWTSAGCQDLAWASDSYGKPAVAVSCGVNGVTLMHLDGGGNWTKHTKNAGNTSYMSGRPQRDYALAICWSCSGKVYRFEKGAWATPYASPKLTGASRIGFSSDGKRALLLGGYGGSPAVARAHEYRHDLMGQTDFTDVSIPNFDKAPYNAKSGAQLNAVAWRPGCDGGLIVGGANSYAQKKGYVIRFQVVNGKKCP